MGRKIWVILIVGMMQGLFGQQTGELPPDLRAHNLLYLNPSIFNPAFAMDQQVPHRVGIWSRWQWQTPDTDPTTLLVNYSGRSRSNAYGGGFFQNNTSLYKQTGGYLNYAFDIPLGEESSITFGANLFGFQQQISDARSFLNEPILHFSDEKIIGGLAHYTFPLANGDETTRTFVRPVLYVKSIPGYDTQYGLNTVWAASRFWLQAGYNSFYGPSAGLGGRFLSRFRVGGLVEIGLDNAPEGDELTFEFMASVDLGPIDGRKKVVGFEVPEETGEEALEEEARLDSIARAAAAERLAQQRVRDSLEEVRRVAELAEARRVQDSLEQARQKQLALERDVTPEQGERYQEVTREDGLEPGFYLIANVFGTQKYYEAFMKKLQEQGIAPRSFYRATNKYNYVYLQRYDSIQQARQARDSKFGGRYTGELWIFRVR